MRVARCATLKPEMFAVDIGRVRVSLKIQKKQKQKIKRDGPMECS